MEWRFSLARPVAASVRAVAAIDAARWRQDLRSRPGRAAAVNALPSPSLRCAVALYPITLRVALAALWCTPRCAQIFELYLCWQTSWSFRGTNFWNPMERVALGTGEPCERPWRSMTNESFHRLRSNIFEVSVLFERAHSLEPAHIHSTALACCAQCTSCEALVCARSVSVVRWTPPPWRPSV